MKIEDVFWLSFKDLREKKVRTALTIIMVVIGVAAIVGLVSLTAGINASIGKDLSILGPTTVLVSPTGQIGFTYADTALLSGLSNISAVIPVVTGGVNVYSNGQNISASIVGIAPQDIQQMVGNLSIYQGALYQDAVSPSALVGYSIAFPKSGSTQQYASVGQSITVKTANGGTYTVPVVGVLNTYGSSIVPVDTSIFMSLSAAEVLLHQASFTAIVVKANSVKNVSALVNQISDIYGTRASVVSTQQITQTVSQITGSIGLLLGAIAGISLLVAAIGIMNIMLISVYERTHEIGIFKSIGFKSRDILMIFLFQALIIGILGGIIGIIAGAGGSFGLASALTAFSAGQPQSNSTAGGSGGGGGGGGGGPMLFGGGGGGGGGSFAFSPVILPSTVIAALLVATIVSVLAGVYPAWRASKLEPIDALRAL